MRSSIIACALVVIACGKAPEKCDGGSCAGTGGGGGFTGTGGGGGGSGLQCPDSISPPNFVDNPGFECDLAGWDDALTFSKLSISTDAHNGSKSARIDNNDGGTATRAGIGSLSSVTPIAGHTYCMIASGKGQSGSFNIQLTATAPGVAPIVNFASPIVSNVWTRVPPGTFNEHALRYKATAQDTRLQWKVYLVMPAGSTDYALVDDVQVWDSPDGGCAER